MFGGCTIYEKANSINDTDYNYNRNHNNHRPLLVIAVQISISKCNVYDILGLATQEKPKPSSWARAGRRIKTFHSGLMLYGPLVSIICNSYLKVHM